MQPRQELGKQIRNARKAAGFTQKDLASRMSVTREQLSHYENGKSAVPANVLVEIAEALNTEFTIRGYRIGPSDSKRVPEKQRPIQLCFDLDTEYTFRDSVFKIKPTTRSIQINAVVNRASSA